MLWVKRILNELKVSNPTQVNAYCDNKTTISIAHSHVFHDKTKHDEVDKHFIKKKIENGQIYMNYVQINEHIADVLTKGLTKKQFEKLTSKLDMKDIFNPA